MTEVCVDASLAVKMVLRGERLHPHARQIFVDSAIAGGTIIAPSLFVSEVDSVIRLAEHTGRITLADANAAYGELDAMDVRIVESPGIRPRARQMARRFGQERVYDSTYAALAEIRGCEFWTADHAFYVAVKAELTFVRFLADYPLP